MSIEIPPLSSPALLHMLPTELKRTDPALVPLYDLNTRVPQIPPPEHETRRVPGLNFYSGPTMRFHSVKTGQVLNEVA